MARNRGRGDLLGGRRLDHIYELKVAKERRGCLEYAPSTLLTPLIVEPRHILFDFASSTLRAGSSLLSNIYCAKLSSRSYTPQRYFWIVASLILYVRYLLGYLPIYVCSLPLFYYLCLIIN